MTSEFFILMRNELGIALLIFILLFIKIGKGLKPGTTLLLIQILLFANLLIGFTGESSGSLFAGMFRSSPLIVLEKAILNLGVLLISLLNTRWLKQHEHLAEFFMLMLSALLGMFFMISSGNLLIFYLSLELSTIPVAALANFDLEKRISSEAAMKMILSSAFSSGLLLFGISLVYGSTGSIQFAEIPSLLNGSSLQVMAFILLVTGFAFKLSVVPFHLWTADVYEGSPVAVTAFLSVISKGAMTFIFITTLYRVFEPLHTLWYAVITLLSAFTIITGNLFAIRQQNLKRFLAYSSISQVGFILAGISGFSAAGEASAVYFILIYLFSNLAAFGVISIVSAETGKERIDEYRGFYKQNKFLTWMLTLALFSLAGIPPTAGFFGKFFLLAAGASTKNYVFITIASLNLMVSLFYYLKVVFALFSATENGSIAKIRTGTAPVLAFLICAAGILATGFFGQIYEYILRLCQ